MLETPESIIFIIGAIIMLFSALIFFFWRKRSPHFYAAFLVSSITLVSYLVMLEGSLATVSGVSGPVYFSRWVFYIGSCCVLMLTITKVLNVVPKNKLPIIVLNGLVMLSGAIAAVYTSEFKWLAFAVGCLFFIWQLALLFENVACSPTRRLITLYILFGWSLFPVVFILAPEGLGILGNFTAIAIYLALDVFTKIVFYFHLQSLEKEKRPSGESR